MRVVISLLLILPALASTAPSTPPNNTSALLFLLVNPTTDLGFADDAAGVSLPNVKVIANDLTDAQQDEIIQKTLADIDRAYGGVTVPLKTPSSSAEAKADQVKTTQ